MTDLGNAITSFFGTTFEYYNILVNQMAKVSFPYQSYSLPDPVPFEKRQFKLEDMVEDINESHVTHWTEMTTSSTPPVVNSPYSAYMDLYQLKRHVVAFNAQKLKEVVGYKLRKPLISHEILKEIIDKHKAEGTWPNVEPKS